MNKAIMILTNGFEEVEALGTLGIFRRSGLICDVASFVGHDAKGRFGVHIDNLFDINEINFDEYEMLIIPGGPQYKTLSNDPKFKEIVLDFASKNKFIGAICAAPTLLGNFGLLKNKKYVCFKSMDKDFGGTFIDQYVVRDGKLITAVSAAASIDFGFALVEALGGKNLADDEKKSIYYKD